MDVVKNLEKAREIITPREKWIVGNRWRELKEGGYAHCALGAIEMAKGGISHKNSAKNCDPEVVALAAAIPANEKAKALQVTGVHAAQVAHYNNRIDHETVLKWFDKAIQLQREHPMEKV